MNQYKLFYDKEKNNIEIQEKIKMELLSQDINSWQDLYWASKYLYDYSQLGTLDKIIIEALELSQSRGLNSMNNLEYFLDSSRILAKMYFKYNMYKAAENCLMMLRDFDGYNTPGWVYIYSAATAYKNDLNYSLSYPNIIISYLSKGLKADSELIIQHNGIIKDFLNSSAEMLINEKDNSKIKIGIKELYDYIEPFTNDVLNEWSNFILTTTSVFFNDNSKVSANTEYNNILWLQIKSQKTKIDKIESLLDEYNLKLEELINDKKQTPFDKEAASDADNVINASLKQDTKSEYNIIGRRPKFLIFGANQIPIEHMRGIAKDFGVDKNQLEFLSDYDNNKRFDFDKIRFNSPYGGILIGPNAHKMIGIDEYSSILQKLTKESGFPHVEEIRSAAGELKITKSSFREAFAKMMAHMESIGI